MKRFDIFYHLFIFTSMTLSTIQAPLMFIEHNVLAGWLWVLVFLIMLFLLIFGVIDKTKEAICVEGETCAGKTVLMRSLAEYFAKEEEAQ